MRFGRRACIVAVIFATSTLYGSVAFAADCCRCTNPDDPKAVICIQQTSSDCNGLETSSPNFGVKKLNCTTSLTEGQCRAIINGGVCLNEPVIEKAYLPTPKPQASVAAGTSNFELGVPIPGLTFAPITESGGQVHVSWFAQYIAAIQKYLLGLSVVAAAVAITYGGFRYLVGSAAGSVSRGKEIITDAVIGLLLTFGAYLILFTINPATVSPIPLDIQSIKYRNAFTDAAQERAIVVESARIRPKVNADVEVPIIDLDAPPTPAGISPTTPQPATPGGTPTAPPTPTTPEPKVGEIAKDSVGNLIAQGDCPKNSSGQSDMVEIKHSDAYTQANVPSFCMDRYEAPNQQGVKPFLGVIGWEADWYCKERGKRLCTDTEWVRACLGSEGKNTYGYGPVFDPGRDVSAHHPSDADWWATTHVSDTKAKCNYDSVPPLGKVVDWSIFTLFTMHYPPDKPEFSILNPNNPRLSDTTYISKLQVVNKEIDKLNRSEPSGARSQCITPEGVYDLNGNVAEIAISKQYAVSTLEQRTKLNILTQDAANPYPWMGFYWAPVPHKASSATASPTCTFSLNVHPIGWRDYAVGFRCCMNLSE